jgi:ketosteroid isomerase-like protein
MEYNMKRLTLVFVWIGLIAGLNILWAAKTPKVNKAELTIRTIMDNQVKAWNEGNIDGFMAAYWPTKELTFQSGNKRLQGWDELIAMYKKSYAGAKMGKLEFTDLIFNSLTPDVYYVLGRWRVTAGVSVKEGLFTIIFRKLNNEWKIIHDHSS